MNSPNPFQQFRFQRSWFSRHYRLVVVLVGVGLFAIAWWIIPIDFLFFLLVLPLVALVWAATFGWRQALSILSGGLHRLVRWIEEVSNEQP